MSLSWDYIHKGFYRSESVWTDNSFIVRTRPLNDGWMSIDEGNGLVMATGLKLSEAKDLCERVDQNDENELRNG